jgi:hypothetical protein
VSLLAPALPPPLKRALHVCGKPDFTRVKSALAMVQRQGKHAGLGQDSREEGERGVREVKGEKTGQRDERGAKGERSDRKGGGTRGREREDRGEEKEEREGTEGWVRGEQPGIGGPAALAAACNFLPAVRQASASNSNHTAPLDSQRSMLPHARTTRADGQPARGKHAP